MSHPLLPAWEKLIEAFALENARDTQLRAMLEFREVIGGYYEEKGLKGSVDDLCTLLEELQSEVALPVSLALLDRLDGMHFALSDLNKNYFKKRCSVRYKDIQTKYIGPLLALIPRLASIVSRSLHPDDIDASPKRINEASEADKTETEQFYRTCLYGTVLDEIKALNTAIDQCLAHEEMIGTTKELFVSLWSDTERSAVALIILDQNNAWVQPTFNKYYDFVLCLMKNTSDERLPTRSLNSDFVLHFAKIKSKRLMASKDLFFQKDKNKALLQETGVTIHGARNIQTVQASLKELAAKYEPREGIFLLVNFIRTLFSQNFVPRTAQKAEEISDMINYMSPVTSLERSN